MKLTSESRERWHLFLATAGALLAIVFVGIDLSQCYQINPEGISTVAIIFGTLSFIIIALVVIMLISKRKEQRRRLQLWLAPLVIFGMIAYVMQTLPRDIQIQILTSSLLFTIFSLVLWGAAELITGLFTRHRKNDAAIDQNEQETH